MARTDELAAGIGRSIRRARKDTGLTQQQLGELAGLSDRTIREIETRHRTPGLRSVLTVLAVLGLDVEVS